MGVHTLLWAKRQVFSVFFGKLRKHVYVCVWVCVRSQSCPTLCDPMDCSLPGFSVHGVFQGRTLEGVAFPFSGNMSTLDQ